MDARTYLKVSLTNLALVAAGFGLGVFLTSHASPVTAQAQSPAEFEDIDPVMRAGSAAFGTLLASRVVTDRAVVGGLDLLRLHEGTLNLITKKLGVRISDVNDLVDAATVHPQPRMRPPQQPKPPEAPKGGEKK